MRFLRMTGFLLGIALGLAVVAIGAYTAYVARLWLRAMKA